MEQTRSIQYTLPYVMAQSPKYPNCCPVHSGYYPGTDTYNPPHSVNPRGKGSDCNKLPSYLALINTTHSVIKHVPSDIMDTISSGQCEHDNTVQASLKAARVREYLPI